MGIKEIASGRSDLFQVHPDKINIKEGWNSRDFNLPENKQHVEELAKSIAEVGVKTAVKCIIENDTLYLTDGESRLRAVRLAIKRGAEIISIPVIMEKAGTESDRLFTQIVGNSGKQFTPLETAHVFKRLVDYGWSEADIASKSGKTKPYVKDILALVSSDDELVKKVKEGKVSATLASQTLKKAKGDGKKAAEQIAAAEKTAAKKGKTKVTARDVGKAATGKTFKTEAKEILGRAIPSVIPGMPTGEHVEVKFTAADWTRLCEIAKIGK